MSTLVWFRRDFRLHDHPALKWAIDRREPALLLYIWAPEEEDPWRPGAASRWWLHHSLRHFKEKIEKLGAQLIIKKGNSAQIIEELCKQAQIKAVAWNKLYEPSILKRDEKIVSLLRSRGIEVKQFNGSLLIEPWQLQTKSNSPYKVFTPYFKAFPSESPDLLPIREIRKIPTDSSARNTLTVEDLNLLPTIRWDSEFYNHWKPGETHGQKLFLNFLNSNILEYKKSRDYPAQSGTSKISPYLHFGELSPKWILAEWRRATSKMKPTEKDQANWFIRELIWREFSHNILFHFPHTSDSPLDEKFQKFAWKKNDKFLSAWKNGETGFEIVDAGMKELWATGWMHNRVRMIVASFLTKDLLISWHEGAQWFWDTLVDANLANNSMGWQWAGGCGADAAPYFRVFNPSIQSEKFDPEKKYIRQWLKGRKPQIPIVDHKNARLKALEAYKQMREK